MQEQPGRADNMERSEAPETAIPHARLATVSAIGPGEDDSASPTAPASRWGALTHLPS